jgi:tetratricopeptide (TPR) repeat protein
VCSSVVVKIDVRVLSHETEQKQKMQANLVILIYFLISCWNHGFGRASEVEDVSVGPGKLWDSVLQAIEQEHYTVAYYNLLQLDRAEQIMPKDKILQLMGAVALKLGDHAAASRHLENAFALNSQQPAPIYANYVLALHRSGAIEKAIEIAEVALKMYPNSMVVHYNAADLFSDAKHPETRNIYVGLCLLESPEARTQSCVKAMVLSRQSPEALKSLMNKLNGETDEPHMAILEEFMDQLGSTEGPIAYSRACQLILKDVIFSGGGVTHALRISTALSEWFDQDAMFLLDVGVLYYFNGEFSSSLKYCQEASLYSDSYLVHACIGATAVYLSEEELAVSSLHRASELLEQGHVSLASVLFDVDATDINFNLLSALYSFGRYQQCVDVAASMLDLPPLDDGGALVLALSLVNWSRINAIEFLIPLQIELSGQHVLNIPRNKSLLHEVLRLHRHHENEMLLPMACSCASSLEEPSSGPWTAATSVLGSIIVRIDEKNSRFNSLNLSRFREDTTTGIVLMTQYFYPEDGGPETAAVHSDIMNTLIMNLRNDFIDKVVVFCTQQCSLDSLLGEWGNKIYYVQTDQRLTFQHAFRFANDYLVNKTVVLGKICECHSQKLHWSKHNNHLANSDIYFDARSLARLGDTSTLMLSDSVIALSKWIKSKARPGELELPLRVESQDAWIFTPPLSNSVVTRSDFYVGAPRCDNVLASILIEEGYDVLNPAFAIKAIEWTSSRARHGALYGIKGSVLGSGRPVFFSDKFIF